MLHLIIFVGVFVLIVGGTTLLIANEQRKSLIQKHEWQQQDEYWPGKKRDERWLNPASSSLDQQRWLLILGAVLGVVIAMGLLFFLL
jgi:hypothetical protein